MHFFIENFGILITFSLKFIPKVPITNIPAMVLNGTETNDIRAP